MLLHHLNSSSIPCPVHSTALCWAWSGGCKICVVHLGGTRAPSRTKDMKVWLMVTRDHTPVISGRSGSAVTTTTWDSPAWKLSLLKQPLPWALTPVAVDLCAEVHVASCAVERETSETARFISSWLKMYGCNPHPEWGLNVPQKCLRRHGAKPRMKAHHHSHSTDCLLLPPGCSHRVPAEQVF